MKLTKFHKVSFVSAVTALTLFSTSLPAYAATVASPVTDADIGFQKNDAGTTDPLYPENPDPEDPVGPDPTDPPNPPTRGALRMDVVPSIHFGEDNKIEAKTQNYYAKFATGIVSGETAVSEITNYLQVTDARGGTQGFKVSVKNDGIFTAGTSKIEGAVLTLGDFSVYSGSNIVDTNVFPTVSATPVAISDNANHDLLTAAVGQGYGIWTMPMGDVATKTSGQGVDGTGTTGAVDSTKEGRNPAIKLTIPAGQIIQPEVKYTSKLNWTLSDNI